MQYDDESAVAMPSSELGLNIACDAHRLHSFAESVRQLAFACESARLPFIINDLQPHPSLRSFYRQIFREQFDSSLKQYISETNPYPVNLIRFNPSNSERLFSSNPRYFAGKVNVAWWSWELPKVPPEWIQSFRHFNEVWVLSNFIREIFAKVSPTAVRKINFPLQIDETSIDARKFRVGFGQDACVFLFAFEYQSGFQIKNPLGLIDAFSRAFSKTDKALLVIKTMPFSVNPTNLVESVKRNLENSRKLQNAVKEASEHVNIIVMDGHFTRAEFFSLLASADCYVSMHRAEGYGQVLAQSMYLAKPVIATGYSGNLDFMNESNSILLPYELVEVDRDDRYYRPYVDGNLWAEPHVDKASQMMRWVYEHRNEAQELGKRASESMRKLSNPRTVGVEIRENCLNLLRTH